jgi:hypothetical protein
MAGTVRSAGGGGPIIRLAYGRDGELKGGRLLAIAACAALIVAIGTSVAMALAGNGNPEAIAIWTTVAFLGVKVPLLALLWWLLGRHLERPGEQNWDASETREIMSRLRRAAASAADRDDAHDRFAILTDEAWFVANNAPDELTAEAAELALEMASRRDAAAAG